MPPPLRLFIGSTELSYDSAQIVKTNDHIINKGTISIEANPNIDNTSIIDFKKSDGSTNIFSAKVQEIREIDMWAVDVYTQGYELMNIRVETVYENQSPEAIVEDVVGRTENLTYVSGPSSGFTITKYIAKSYAIDIIKDMLDTLQWQLRIDESNNVYFEPKGNINNGRTFTHGDNIQITSWEEHQDTLFNHVKIIGGFENFSTVQQMGSAGTTFTLEHKPAGVMKVGSPIPGGTAEVDPGLYTVTAEQKKVVFENKITNPNFNYSFDRPVIVENQDDDSITDFGEIFEEVPAPWLDTFADARKYSQNLLDVHSSPEVKAKGTEPQLNFDSEVGELVNVVDTVRGKDMQLIITKITLKAESNTTEYEFGSRDFVFFDWQREVQERIKKIELRATNEDDIIFTRLFKHTVAGTASVTNEFLGASPQDSFILSHTTLGRFRKNKDEAANSSGGTANPGTWLGSNLGGAQYTTSGYRLSAGDFNGTDNEITVGKTVNGVQTISIAINPETSNRDICQLTSTAKLTYDNSNSVATSGLTNPTIYVDNVETGSATLNEWSNVVVTFDSISSDAIKIGHSTTWFDGKIDEFTLFNKKISSDERQEIIDKVFYSNRPLYNDCLLWYALDGNRLGSRFGTKGTLGNTYIEDFKDINFKKSPTTANWDTTKRRLELDSSSDKSKTYNKVATSKNLFLSSSTITSATLTADTTLWGNDTITYWMSVDGGSNWESVTNGVSHTFTNTGNNLKWRVIMIGKGANQTYVEEITVVKA